MAPTVDSPGLAPSEVVGRVLRGKKKMNLSRPVGTLENGMENMDDFFSSAKTPEGPRKPFKQTNRKKKAISSGSKKESTKKDKRVPRFSIGDNEEGNNATTADAQGFKKKLEQGFASPGELSQVTTAPPTPKEATPEETRKAAAEEELLTLPQEADASAGRPSDPISPAVPEDDGFPDHDDEDDDLLPPPPPESPDMRQEDFPASDDAVDFPPGDDEEPPAPKTSSSRKRKQRPEPAFPVDDDDDDNEGAGFDMTSPTPHDTSATSTEPTPQPNRQRGRKKKKTSPAETTTTKTPAPNKQANARNKKRTKTMFSPPGYPISNREMRPVPVSDYKETSDAPEGVRRSQRARYAPLNFWKNERLVYGPHSEKGPLAEDMGLMPVPHQVLVANPTPRKERKPVAPVVRAAAVARDELYEKVTKDFDSSKLRKKYRILDGDLAHVWIEAEGDAVEEKVVSYADKLTVTDLPLPPTRKKADGKVVGKAAQSFNIPTREDDICVGYIMGSLLLPPKGMKDAESTGSCSQVFTVCNCQPKSIEVAYGDPHDDDEIWNPETAQRFLLSAGDQFRVPPGNVYRLVNHSTKVDALVAWTIIRPQVIGGAP